jgi:hypothetical protein
MLYDATHGRGSTSAGSTETGRVGRDPPDGFVVSALRVELFFDEEAGNWHFRVPALHINGGGTASREEAERDCLSAVAFALEGDPRDYDSNAETLTFDVSVASAA